MKKINSALDASTDGSAENAEARAVKPFVNAPLSMPGLPDLPANIDDLAEVAEIYGGNYPLHELEIGQRSGYMRFERFSDFVSNLEGSKQEIVKAPIASEMTAEPNENGEIVPTLTTYALPLATVLRLKLQEAKIAHGDIFVYQRGTDAIKKEGRGKGTAMATYAIAVLKRVNEPEGE